MSNPRLYDRFPDKRLLASIFLAAAVFSPVLASGWEGDDLLNSLLFYKLRLAHESPWHQGLAYMRLWIEERGRFYPLSAMVIVLSAFFKQVLVYKLCMLCLTVGNVALFAGFVRQITGKTSLAMASVFMAPIIMQTRHGHEGQMSYYGFLQFTVFFITASLALLWKYHQHAQRRYWLGAAALYAASLLLYAITYPFFLLHVILLRLCAGLSWRQTLRQGWIFPLLSSLGALLCAVLRLRASSHSAVSDAYIPNFDGVRVLNTFMTELLASVPLSYLAFDPHHMFGPMGRYIVTHISFLPIMVVAGYGAAVYGIAAEQRTETRAPAHVYRGVACLGATWWALASALIALSPKYQDWSVKGGGYLNVYLGNFGALLLTVALIGALSHITWPSVRIKKRLQAGAACALALMAGLQLTCNSMMIYRHQFGFQHARNLVERALQKGLLDALPAHAYLYVDNDGFWDTLPFYDAWSPRGLHGVNSRIKAEFLEYLDVGAHPAPEASHSLFYLRYAAESADHGYVLLAPLSQVAFDSQGHVVRARGGGVRLFAKHPLFAPLEMALVGDRFEADRRTPFYVFSQDMQLDASGNDWQLAQIDGDFDLRSLFSARTGLAPSAS